MKKLKIAVIGCGDIAKSMLLIFKITKGIEVVDLCDVNSKRLIKQGRKFKKAGKFVDYNEMLDKTSADAVYIAVPHYLHYPMMKKAIECKKHIFCEKPITINNDNAEEIIKAADNKGLVIAVNYQYRYDRHCHRLVKAVQSKELGNVNFIRCIVPWCRSEKYFKNAPWHSIKEKSGGGTLITQGSHLLDIILWMNGCGVKMAEGVCRQMKFKDVEVEDFCFAELELENGVPVQFLSTMAAPVEGAVRLEVYGDKGYGEYIKKFGSRVIFKGVRPDCHSYGKPAVHAVQKSARDFRDAVLEGKRHLCPGEEAAKTLKAVNFIYQNTE